MYIFEDSAFVLIQSRISKYTVPVHQAIHVYNRLGFISSSCREVKWIDKSDLVLLTGILARIRLYSRTGNRG